MALKAIYLAFFVNSIVCFSQTPPITYPRIAAYTGIVHPLVTFSKTETVTNFKNAYTVGFPVGINVWKSAKVGFSFEVVPFIKAENHVSKMNNFLFHPGILLGLGHGFTLAGRAAFETSGRYGFTPVFNKIAKRNKNSHYFVAIPLPVRFGNDKPASFAVGFQFGLGF